MCTLALSIRPTDDILLQVAANRDELLARPSEPPQLWGRTPELLAPKDALGGGTWLGLNAAGLFVAITNRMGAPRDPTRRSRGMLVAEALAQSSARALHEWLRQLDVAAFSPFNLVYVDAAAAFATAWTGAERLAHPLAQGLHVFTERSFGAGEEAGRIGNLRGSWPAEHAFEALPKLLAQHDDSAPFDAPCVHAPAFGYGTRSSFLLELRSRGRSRMAFTEGAPCTVPFVEGTPLLNSLGFA